MKKNMNKNLDIFHRIRFKIFYKLLPIKIDKIYKYLNYT